MAASRVMLPRFINRTRQRDSTRKCFNLAPLPLIILDSFVLGFVLGCVTFCWFAGFLVSKPEDSSLYHHIDYDALISSSSAAGKSGCSHKEPIQLLVIVPSQPLGFGLRNAIRNTWLKNATSTEVAVTSKFVVGLKNLSLNILDLLDKEQRNYQDLLLLEDLQDTYKNLTLKLKMTLQWVNKSIPTFDYIVKVDDDSFVRLDKLAKAIRGMDCNKRLYWGYFLGHALPVRTGQWKEVKWRVCSHYLPYALGGGYVLSKQVVDILLRYSHRLKMYCNEDVAIGSWLAPYDITRTHDLRFDVEAKSHGCSSNHIISHKQETADFYQKHTNLNRHNKLCSEEVELVPSYVYNWTTLPRECCKRIENLSVPAT